MSTSSSADPHQSNGPKQQHHGQGVNLEFAALDPRFHRFSNYHSERTPFAVLAYGHAGKPKVLQYDLSRLVQAGAIRTALNSKGTIFSMDMSLWRTMGIYLGISIASAVCAFGALTDADGMETADLENISDYLNGFIPFILGLYVSLNLSRWWALREHGLGRILDSAQNVALICSSMLPGPQWHDFHDQCLRYALASVSLMINTCRCRDDIDNLGKQRDNLLTDEELDLVRQVPYRPRPLVMWSWILVLCQKIFEEQQIAPAKQRDVTIECVKARDAVSVIWTYLGTQLPFAYVHLVTFLININNLVMAVKCGIVFAASMHSSAYQKACNQIVFAILVPGLYHGLLSISYIIHDPFGEDMLDFPVMAFQEYMNEASVSIIDTTHKCPGLKRDWGAPVSGQLPASTERSADGTRQACIGIHDRPPSGSSPGALEKDRDGDYSPRGYRGSPRPENRSGRVQVQSDDTIAPGLDSGAVSKEEFKQMIDLMMGQIQDKNSVMGILQEQNKSLESQVQALNNRVRQLEGKLSGKEVIKANELKPNMACQSVWCINKSPDSASNMRQLNGCSNGR